jgi:hypothetical protein
MKGERLEREHDVEIISWGKICKILETAPQLIKFDRRVCLEEVGFRPSG